MCLQRPLRAFLLVILLMVGASVNSSAQTEVINPTLQITGIDISEFPTISVSIFGDNLGISLGNLNLDLYEDSTLQSLQKDTIQDVGIQTALVLDASSNIRFSGNTGEPRYQEVARAVLRLVSLEILSASTDWLAVYTTSTSDDTFRVISDWQQDHGSVANRLINYQPNDRVVYTPLFNLIDYALSGFVDSGVPSNLQKSIVVFSDGVDVVSPLNPPDIIRRAQEMNVRVHTVMIGPERVETRRNLKRISDLTGGQYFVLTSLPDLDPLWESIATERRQRVVTYQMAQAQPRTLKLVATIPNGVKLEREANFPTVGAKPPQITILEPVTEQRIERTADSFSVPLQDYTPKVLPIRYGITWPDGHPRSLSKIEFILNDDTRVQNSEPFETFTFPIDSLPSGRYTLRIVAYDNLGLSASSEPTVIQVQVTSPPTPTPTVTVTSTPAPTATPTFTLDPTQTPVVTIVQETIIVTQTVEVTPFVGAGPIITPSPEVPDEPDNPPSENTFWYLIILAMLILLALIVYRMVRRKQSEDSNEMWDSEPGSASGEWTDPALSNDLFGDATEPVPVFESIPSAWLALVDNNQNLPSKLPLIGGGKKIRIGRRQENCDLVLNDKRVSRVHATIVEKPDGFHISDEASAGGTFVNKQEVKVGDRLLRHGDIVNFNAVAYRFELTEFMEPISNPSTPVDVSSKSGQNLYEDWTKPRQTETDATEPASGV